MNSSSYALRRQALRRQARHRQTWHVDAPPQSTTGPIRAQQGRAVCHFPPRQDICAARPPVANREHLSSEIKFELKGEGVGEEFKQAAGLMCRTWPGLRLRFSSVSLCPLFYFPSAPVCLDRTSLLIWSYWTFSCNLQENLRQTLDISPKKEKKSEFIRN